VDTRSRWQLYRERLGIPGAVVAIAAIALCCIGLGVAASVDATTERSMRLFAKQAIRLLAAVPICGLVVFTRPRWIRRNAYVLYGVSLVLLAAVLAVGPVVNGARRWLGIGDFRFQPSDLAKLALCLALARFLALRARAENPWRLGAAIAFACVPAALILKEPDLGTALTFVPILGSVVLVAGARRKHLAFLGAALLASIVLLAIFGLHNYQAERVRTWWHQNDLTRAEKLAEGYHLHRSKIAIGSGGVLGYGFADGPQNSNDLLPERHTDFAFSVLSEEWGFVGSVTVLLLELAIPLGLLWIARRVREPFARLSIVGIGSQIGAQALVNLGVATGAFPTTGIALPLVSYGGSSAVMTLLSIAVALQLAARAEPVLAAEAFEESEEATSLMRPR
jgi:rod shape determining protein RodA